MFDLSFDGAIATLTLDRAAARNAIGLSGWSDLRALLTQVRERGARALIVRSAVPGCFCAGSDIGEMPALQAEAGKPTEFRQEMGATLAALAALPCPTIAVIDGHCYGAGVALMLACDMALAGPQSRFAITPARLGITYPQSDVARLVARIGPQQAALLLLTAEPVDAVEAVRIGLTGRYVEAPDDEARLLATSITANAPRSLRAIKRSIALAASGIANDDAADEDFDRSFAGTELTEGLQAFRERRRPHFAAPGSWNAIPGDTDA